MTNTTPDVRAHSQTTSASNRDDTNSSRQIIKEIDGFVSSVDSLENTLPLIGAALNAARQKEKRQLDKYEQKHAISVDTEGDSRTVTLTSETFAPYRRLARNLHKASRATLLIPEIFVVALVSQYDAFLGGLIRVLLNGRLEILHATDRQLPLASLLAFDSMADVRDAIVNKEVEDLLRKSHAEQFSWLESRFKIELRKGLLEWPAFVELTERRNLYVHARGVVSRQYLETCRAHNVYLPPDHDLGVTLYASGDYFVRAHSCVLSIGVMLGHVLWRKFFPDQRQHADIHLTNICYDLLVERRYDLAQRLLTFAVSSFKKFAHEKYRRMFVVNLAQTYKWMNDDKKCAEIMDAEDWTASDESFRLAHAVLRDDIENSVRIMRQIGAEHDEIDAVAYRDWPLFREIRKEELFRTTYQDIFGAPLEQIEMKTA